MTTTNTEPDPVIQGAPAVAVARPPGLVRRAFRALTGSERIRDALAALPHPTLAQKVLCERAETTYAIATRTLEPTVPVAGSTVALALDLYRQAAYWALLAVEPSPGRPTPGALFDQSRPVLTRLGVPEEDLAELGGLFTDDASFVGLTELPAEKQLAATRLLRALVDRLLDGRTDATIRLARLRFWRGVRLGAFLGAVFGLVWLVVALIPERPDLAKGKPWSISSAVYPCHPEKPECGGVRTRILFHTKEEKNPWFEIDLGAPMRFSSLSVRNRSDCCQARAVPLVAEVSDDRNAYRQVASRAKNFETWEPSFPAQTARYVRLRVDRTSFLHLDEVRVHP